jgi:hypothetical protein
MMKHNRVVTCKQNIINIKPEDKRSQHPQIKQIRRCQPWKRESQEKVENHSDECTTPVGPISNYIETYTTGTHEREG